MTKIMNLKAGIPFIDAVKITEVWTPASPVLLWLTSFTQHHVLHAHPRSYQVEAPFFVEAG